MLNSMSNLCIKIEFYWVSLNCERKFKDTMNFTSLIEYNTWLKDVTDYVEIINIR